MNKHHNDLLLALAAYMVAVAEHGRTDAADKAADQRFILATQALADDQREFCRRMEIGKSLRVVKDTHIAI
jgi:hypothetical protein